MDFNSLVRKDLQFLCKKNGIAANLANVSMANALQALQTVEGIEEIQLALGLQSPKKAEGKSSPDGSRTGRASSRRAIHGEESNIKQSSTLPRRRLLTSKPLKAEGKNKDLTKVLPKTPATRKSGKASKTQSSRIRSKNEEEDEGPSETPKPVESGNINAIGPITRRGTRLSSRKPLDETDTIHSGGRRSTRAKATVDKMGSLCRIDANELEKEDEFGEKGDSCVDLPDEEDEVKVESYDLSSSLVGEVAKIEDENDDSGDLFVAEHEDLFVDVLDADKGDYCIKLDVEDVMKDQGESHVLPSPHDWLSSNVEVDIQLAVSTEESLPLSTEKGDSCIKRNAEDVMKDQGEIHVLPSPRNWVSSNVEIDLPVVVSTEECLPFSAMESSKDFHDKPLMKLLMEDSMDQLPENKPVKDSGDFLSLGIKHDVSSDLWREETGSCFLREKDNLSLLFTKISLKDLEESGNSLLEDGVSQVASELVPEIPKEAENSDLALNSEIAASFIKAFAKFSEQIEDQSNAREIVTCEIIHMPQETEISQDATQDSRTEFVGFQNAAEFSFEPTIADYVIEKGADCHGAKIDTDLAEDNLLNLGELATIMSIIASDEFENASTPGSVDLAPQISSSELQIPASGTKFSETLLEMKEETLVHPAAIAAPSPPDEKLPIESAQLSPIQTQLLNSEEADMSPTGMTVDKVEKRVEKENSVQDENLKNISLIKLRSMYKQKLDCKKNDLERGNSMIRQDVEIFGRIVIAQQKIENENTEKLEMENSMIRREGFELCTSLQKLGKSETKRTPLKNLN